MLFLETVTITGILTWSLLVLTTVLLSKILWKRRWLYYYAARLPGKFAWPLLGNGLDFQGGRNAFYYRLLQYVDTHPEVFKIWFGPDLHIVTSRLNDADIILTDYLEKSSSYRFGHLCFGNGLVTSRVKVWKGRRKTINQTFNQRILNSYTEAFVKHSNRFMDDVRKTYRGSPIKLLPKIWQHSVNAFCESFADISPELVIGQEKYIMKVRRYEEIVVERSLKPWLFPNFIFNHSKLGESFEELAHFMWPFINQLMDLKRKIFSYEPDLSDDHLRSKRYLNHLFGLLAERKLNENDVSAELQNMIVAGTETSTYALCFTILILAMYPEVQKNVQKELDSLFGESDRDPTLEDVNNMEYLERVVKESLRFFPPIPFVMRFIDETIEIDSQVFPVRSNVIIPMMKIHMRPDVWPDPSRFDPDRFLPEEVEKRHRCAYMPFSHGSRNCPGWKIGITGMKINLSSLLRVYTVKPVLYNTIKEIELDYAILMMPKDECQVLLEKRNKLVVNSSDSNRLGCTL
ncbi:unnamed protein product [Tenebrio molitor]|nr:unnamed protein product [Tenebrio molitor]